MSDLKKKIPQNMSFAEVLADDLKISIDSAYRRIRNDTNLTFEELRILCSKYQISLDSYFFTSDDFVQFNYRAINHKGFTFEEYIHSLLYNLNTVQKYDVNELIYTAKDIPLFYIFKYPSLAAFKIHFWNKCYFQKLTQEDMVFDESNFSGDMIDLILKVSEKYMDIGSTEIWGEETITISLKQIEYEYNNKGFKNNDQALKLCENLESIINNIQIQVEQGVKSKSPGNTDDNTKFTFYYNNIIITENMVYYKMGDMRLVHLGHNVLNILSTTDPVFCSHTYQILQNIIRNSVCLTGQNSEIRSRFFKSMKEKIGDLTRKIENG